MYIACESLPSNIIMRVFLPHITVKEGKIQELLPQLFLEEV